jgi:hypothetical protein
MGSPEEGRICVPLQARALAMSIKPTCTYRVLSLTSILIYTYIYIYICTYIYLHTELRGQVARRKDMMRGGGTCQALRGSEARGSA